MESPRRGVSLGFVCRSSVPTKVIQGDPGVGLGASVLLGGAIGGAIAAYRMANAPSDPGVTIETTNTSRLGRIFKKAAKKRKAEGEMALRTRLAQNQGSLLIPYPQIQALVRNTCQTSNAIQLP